MKISVFKTIKRVVIFIIPFCLILYTNTSTYNAHQSFRTTDKTVIGMLQFLPKDYEQNSAKYPLVIFLHGIIERGVTTNDPALLESTIHSVDNVGPPRHVREGYEFPFIMICPQLKHEYETWPVWYVLEVVDWAKRNLRVDEKRIHITGLSLGGGGVFDAIENAPHVFASAAPVCAPWNSPSKAANIARENVAVWAFHGQGDPQVPFVTTSSMINAINESSPAPDTKAMATIYTDLNHNVWDRAYMPDHEHHSPNLYDWMMLMVNTRKGADYLPSANAGKDIVVHQSTVDLKGAGSDPDGRIVKWEWSRLTGPLASFIISDNSSGRVKLTRKGTYTFRLTITDTAGNTDSDFVTVQYK